MSKHEGRDVGCASGIMPGVHLAEVILREMRGALCLFYVLLAAGTAFAHSRIRNANIMQPRFAHKIFTRSALPGK